MNKDELKAQYGKAESATDAFLSWLAANKFSAAIFGAVVLVIILLVLFA